MSVSEETLYPSSDSFWEVDCYKRTVKRQDEGLRLCNDLMQLIQERADIEKHYAKSLKAWSKKWGEAIEKGPEYGLTEAAWKATLTEADSVADIHLNVKEELISEVQGSIKTWKIDNFHKPMVGPCKETKMLEDDFRKAQKPWAKKLTKVMDAKKKYHMACKLEKTASNQESNARGDATMSGEQVKKIQEKADKLRKDVETTRERYEATLNDLNAYNAKYMEDMTLVFDRSQEMEEKRLRYFREMLIGMHNCLDLSRSDLMTRVYDQFRQTVEQADAAKDLKWWSLNHGTDMAMQWPAFEEYSTEFHSISRKEKKGGGVSSSEGVTITAIKKSESTPHPVSVSESVTVQRPQSQVYNNHGANGTKAPVTSTPPIQRQESYDPGLNPFGEEDDGAMKPVDDSLDSSCLSDTQDEAPLLPAASSSKSHTPSPKSKSKSVIAPKDKVVTKSVKKQSSYDSQLNPFEEEEFEDCSPTAEDSPLVGKSLAPHPLKPKAPSPGRSRNKTKLTSSSKKANQQNPFGDDEWDEPVREGPVDDGSAGVPVRALYDYVGQEEDELSFKVGEVFVKLRDRDDQGWCTGRYQGSVGLYPDNYVETV